MNTKLSDLAYSSACYDFSQKTVLAYLAVNANRDGVCWPSRERIAADISAGVATVSRALKALANDGHITIVRRAYVGQGGYRQNVYQVHPVQAGQLANAVSFSV